MSAPKPLPDDVKSSIAALKLAITTDDEQSDQYLCEMVDDVIAQVVDASHAVPAPEGAVEDKCRWCPHPPHLGLCARRSGGTAYACGCHHATIAHPTPRAEAYVEWCARHANIEKVPGPFCPACAYASVMRDGVKMGRESAPRAQPAPEGAGEAVAWEATGRYGGAPATEYGDSEENARMIYRSRYGAAPDSVRPLVYASPSRPGGA